MSLSLSLSLTARFAEDKAGLASPECPGKAGAGHGARGQWWHLAEPVVAVAALAWGLLHEVRPGSLRLCSVPC